MPEGTVIFDTRGFVGLSDLLGKIVFRVMTVEQMNRVCSVFGLFLGIVRHFREWGTRQ